MKYGGNRVNNCITWTTFIEGVGAAPPDPGQHFSCQLLDVESPTCSSSDGEVYPLDPSGGCNYSSPPLIRARRAAA
ncbi:hypothetical protein NA56DRAFT_699125 [Hyaloscypha hepaticicola]|uniref:Uncharacterized protein n=1 Tax=Hyaloscypha hepaticicola TaxID=2082293 RepID=A0A2J6QIE3_9HELO|nr:hypothetical protein NA56DRAFT_699125 [Hyaloscypha hepaticicola]